MRRFAFAIILLCGWIACAAAQSVSLESFDRGGLPARPQTDVERELARRISAHRRGDVADAAEIQRKLAAYYRDKGDDERARAAEDRANAAAAWNSDPANNRPYGSVQAPAYGVPLPAQGQGRLPTRGGVPLPGRTSDREESLTPGYGGVPMAPYGTARPARREEPKTPVYGPPVPLPPEEATTPASAVPIYVPDGAPEAAAPKKDGTPVHPPEVPLEANTTADGANAAPAATPPPADFSGRFYGLQGQMMHRWEFRSDGTFEHGWAPRNASSGAANVEAGTYRVVGPYVMLVILRGSTGRPAGAGPQTRRTGLQMRGPGGRDGIVLDGMMLKPQTW